MSIQIRTQWVILIFITVFIQAFSVNAQLTDADIEIKKSSTNDVELSVTGGLADDMEALKETLRVSASAGTLSIQQEKKAGISVSYAA